MSLDATPYNSPIPGALPVNTLLVLLDHDILGNSNGNVDVACVILGLIMNDHEMDLVKLIVSTLNLDFDPVGATADTPLYGEGLGLDSIDILEIALAISQQYKVSLHADDENNTEIFASVGALSNYVQEHRP
jgi:acyl carrier protein